MKTRIEGPGDATTREQREQWRELLEEFLLQEEEGEEAAVKKKGSPSKVKANCHF